MEEHTLTIIQNPAALALAVEDQELHPVTIQGLQEHLGKVIPEATERLMVVIKAAAEEAAVLAVLVGTLLLILQAATAVLA